MDSPSTVSRLEARVEQVEARLAQVLAINEQQAARLAELGASSEELAARVTQNNAELVASFAALEARVATRPEPPRRRSSALMHGDLKRQLEQIQVENERLLRRVDTEVTAEASPGVIYM